MVIKNSKPVYSGTVNPKWANKVRKVVKKEMAKEIEKKHYYVTAQPTIANTGTVIALTNIVQGDDDRQRQGLAIKAKSLLIRYNIEMNASALNTTLRLAVVRDNQQISDGTPTWTNIFRATDTNTPLNEAQAGRFTVLYDRKYVLNQGSYELRHGKMFRKLNHSVRYNGVGSGDIQKGGLYLAVLADQPTNLPTLSYYSTLAYTDA